MFLLYHKKAHDVLKTLQSFHKLINQLYIYHWSVAFKPMTDCFTNLTIIYKLMLFRLFKSLQEEFCHLVHILYHLRLLYNENMLPQVSIFPDLS